MDPPHRWTQVDERTWARRNRGVHVVFGSKQAKSGQRWMVIVGASVSRKLSRHELEGAWLRTRQELPYVALSYPDTSGSADIQTYVVPTAEEAQAWANATVIIQEEVEDALLDVSENRADVSADAFGTLHYFENTSKSAQLFVRLCHGWVGSHGAFMVLNALLTHLATPAEGELPSFGPEVVRLPKSMVEELGFDKSGFEPSQKALDYVKEAWDPLQVLKGTQPIPWPKHTPSPDLNPLAIRHHVVRFSQQDTKAILAGFKRLGYKLGDGMLHIACIALYRTSQKLMGKAPDDSTSAVVTLPMSFAEFVPKNPLAMGGVFAPVVAGNIRQAAASFDDGNKPDLSVPLIDGIVARAKGHTMGVEAHQESEGRIGQSFGLLTSAHRPLVLGISLVGQLDGTSLQSTYGTGEHAIKIAEPLWGNQAETQGLSLRTWTFEGQLVIRTMASKELVDPDKLDAWHEEIMWEVDKVAKA